MPFPDAEHAIVTEEKVRDYLLNPNHPVGGPKATWFASLGYTTDNWQELVSDLLRLARTVDEFVAKPSFIRFSGSSMRSGSATSRLA